MEFTLGQIAALIGGEIEGDANQKVATISSIEEAKAGSISFLSNRKYEPYIYETEASGVIVNHDFVPSKDISATLIKVENAYLAFTSLLREYQRINDFSKNGIEEPNHIGASTETGENLYVGAFAYIGEHCTIGSNVKIHPHVYIGDGVSVGDNTIIYPGVKIYPKSRIGSYCTIQAGAVIGSHGFGFAPKDDGSYENVPQIGNVILEDHVDIGANTTIDCATFDSTLIKKGAKIDNLVMLAHNTEIGENTVIASQAGIAGSTKVGKNCRIGGQAGFVGHVSIADGTGVQAQSGVASAVKEPNTMLFGSPAIGYRDYIRSYAVFKKLPELYKKLHILEKLVKSNKSN